MCKKFISLALSLIMLVSLSACSSTTTEKVEVNKEYRDIIVASAEKLKNTYNDYIIVTNIESAHDVTEYLEVIHGDASYTEISIDDETGEMGTSYVGTVESQSYALVDWLDEEGNYYTNSVEIIGAGAEDCEFFKAPSTFTKYVEDRPYLYIHDIIDNATYIKEYEDISIDMGMGVEDFTSYEIGLANEKVKEILGTYSYGLYQSVVDSEGESDVSKKFCNYRLEDLNMDLTFSDAKVIVGIDNNDMLRYLCLETGGLGSRLYYTKAVIATSNDNIREKPDFSSAMNFSDSFKEFADFVADYDTYDEAIKALNSMTSDSSDITVSEELVGNEEVSTN